jgi:four helix bundle protein
MPKDFRELRIWQKAMDLCLTVYDLTDKFPKYELFSLTQQLRESCVSVASNIAEGHARRTNRQFNHFLNITLGSIAETITQLIVAQRRKYAQQAEIDPIISEYDNLSRSIGAMQKTL